MANWLFGDGEILERARVRRAGPKELPYSKEWFRLTEKKIYCYGAGGTLLFALHSLGGVAVAGVVDSNPALWGREILGYTVESPDVFLRDPESVVVVVPVNTAATMTAITGWCQENQIHCVGWDRVNNLAGGEKWDTDIEVIPEAEEAAGIWADELSCATYAVLMKNYSSFSPPKYPACVPNHYFQDFVPRRFYRRFVDLGAFQGDTLATYREWMYDDFDAYYAVEAIPENFAALRTSASDNRVRFFNTAVGATTGTARMRHDPANMYGAAIGDDGDFEVPLSTLDYLLAGESVGIIKMDIEGAEPEALRGAEKIIRRDAPALAISVYHRADHLWTIPLWIKNVCPEYKFFLRHHSDLIGETVCYAVPE